MQQTHHISVNRANSPPPIGHSQRIITKSDRISPLLHVTYEQEDKRKFVREVIKKSPTLVFGVPFLLIPAAIVTNRKDNLPARLFGEND